MLGNRDAWNTESHTFPSFSPQAPGGEMKGQGRHHRTFSLFSFLQVESHNRSKTPPLTAIAQPCLEHCPQLLVLHPPPPRRRSFTHVPSSMWRLRKFAYYDLFIDVYWMAMFTKICLNEIKYVQKKKKIYQDCNSR